MPWATVAGLIPVPAQRRLMKQIFTLGVGDYITLSLDKYTRLNRGKNKRDLNCEMWKMWKRKCSFKAINEITRQFEPFRERARRLVANKHVFICFYSNTRWWYIFCFCSGILPIYFGRFTHMYTSVLGIKKFHL